MKTIPTLPLPSGRAMPVFGVGTWRMGESARVRADEVKAVRAAVERGVTLIDTAEMYGDGEAETIVAEAVGARRDELFIVSKVLPNNASKRGTIAACERSLKRLKTDRIDLYLLHWRGGEPLSETIAAFRDLKAAGKILDWGASNFDIDDMRELATLDRNGECAANQVLYNLTRRGIEFDLVPFCRESGIPVMAYSPLEQARMLGDTTLKQVAQRHDASPAQVALAWLLRQPDIIVIPKATNLKHLDDNIAALDLKLTAEDLTALDARFPPPKRATPLDML
ncbi:aldo/keto reductase [Undibacter mobilis]|uniref:Aldo/keto reductase n=1 Tax=Undibacter mobilis TaxID=2292256 RepID=A0A371BBV6_9BRAD|nr:aldo/keto reductase [Undibacter mobilis]RDV05076.1 aldo/keto reductase [Undibacter mobilis]